MGRNATVGSGDEGGVGSAAATRGVKGSAARGAAPAAERSQLPFHDHGADVSLATRAAHER